MGKTERWHELLKNRILLEDYYLPGARKVQIGAFVANLHQLRCHER